MNREENIKKLEELRALSICKPEDVLKDLSKFNNDQLIIIKEYLSKFIKPSATNKKCMMCNEELCVNWGIIHGVAHCMNCGTNMVAYHYIKDNNNDLIVKINATLQYHGNCYSLDN